MGWGKGGGQRKQKNGVQAKKNGTNGRKKGQKPSKFVKTRRHHSWGKHQSWKRPITQSNMEPKTKRNESDLET